MKKGLKHVKKYFNNKKQLPFGIIVLVIGSIIVVVLMANTFQKNKPTFKTISYDEEATTSAQIAGVFDEVRQATPSPTIKIVVNKIYISPTIIRKPSPTVTRTTTNNSTNTANPTATSAPIQNANAPTPIPNTPTPGPTSTPAATPTPAFGASINTSVDGDTLKVTVEANRPLKTCLIHFLKDVSGADVPVSAQNPGISDNTCSAEYNKSEVKKVRAYIASTDGQTAQPEKSGPFE